MPPPPQQTTPGPGLPARARPALIRRFAGGLSELAITMPAVAILAGTGFAQGGYFAESWGWTALACAWVAALAFLLRRTLVVPYRGLAAVGLLAGLTAWIALSGTWSGDDTQSALDAERVVVYVAALLAALMVGPGSVERLLRGVWIAIVALAGYGLLTRLFPERIGVFDPISGYRLSEPVGYWNSLGLLAAIGVLLALGLAAQAPGRLQRSLAAGSVPVLVSTLYFTFSRGAWVALAAGLVVAFAVDRRRLRFAVVLAGAVPWTAAGVWAAARSDALTAVGSPLATMSAEGHRLALVVACLGAAAGLVTLVGERFEPRLQLSAQARRRWGVGAAVAAAALLALGVARFGSPVTIGKQAWTEFATKAPSTAAGDLNARLFSLSGSGRVDQWRVAANDARAQPWLGSGAGTYERAWNRDRKAPGKVRDAHNLYLETLAELGPVGLVLLLTALALPLTAALAARRSRLGPVAVGAYVAYLLHAAVDWDWEITSVTIAALACGAAVILSGASGARWLSARARTLGAVAALAIAVAAVYTIATRQPITELRSAVSRGDWSAAERHAERASSFAPWSTEPGQVLGDGLIAASRFSEARRALRGAVAKDSGDWALWLSLARASDGSERAAALDRAEELNPRSIEVANFRALLRSVSELETTR